MSCPFLPKPQCKLRHWLSLWYNPAVSYFGSETSLEYFQFYLKAGTSIWCNLKMITSTKSNPAKTRFTTTCCLEQWVEVHFVAASYYCYKKKWIYWKNRKSPRAIPTLFILEVVTNLPISVLWRSLVLAITSKNDEKHDAIKNLQIFFGRKWRLLEYPGFQFQIPILKKVTDFKQTECS